MTNTTFLHNRNLLSNFFLCFHFGCRWFFLFAFLFFRFFLFRGALFLRRLFFRRLFLRLLFRRRFFRFFFLFGCSGWRRHSSLCRSDGCWNCRFSCYLLGLTCRLYTFKTRRSAIAQTAGVTIRSVIPVDQLITIVIQTVTLSISMPL